MQPLQILSKFLLLTCPTSPGSSSKCSLAIQRVCPHISFLNITRNGWWTFHSVCCMLPEFCDPRDRKEKLNISKYWAVLQWCYKMPMCRENEAGFFGYPVEKWVEAYTVHNSISFCSVPSVPFYGLEKRIRQPQGEQGDKVHRADTRDPALAMIWMFQEMCQQCPIPYGSLSSLGFLALSSLLGDAQKLFHSLLFVTNLMLCLRKTLQLRYYIYIQKVCILLNFQSSNYAFPLVRSTLFAPFI